MVDCCVRTSHAVLSQHSAGKATIRRDHPCCETPSPRPSMAPRWPLAGLLDHPAMVDAGNSLPPCVSILTELAGMVTVDREGGRDGDRERDGNRRCGVVMIRHLIVPTSTPREITVCGGVTYKLFTSSPHYAYRTIFRFHLRNLKIRPGKIP